MTDFTIDVASGDDIATMAQWAVDEGWNPGDSDALAFHAADPGGFLIGRLNGQPQCCISVVRYGVDFAFLGFYIARPPVRGQGYGIQLWRAGMARLAGRNVGLDGAVAQQANYRKSGFRLAWNNVRYEGPAPAAAQAPAAVRLIDARAVAFDLLATYDRRFFPAPRDGFLAPWIDLPGRIGVAAVKDGQLCGLGVIRPCRAAARIGPLYAASPQIASVLVGELAKRADAAAVGIDIPERNKAAVALAEAMGLAGAFQTARMYTGADPDIDYDGLFGITSLELG